MQNNKKIIGYFTSDDFIGFINRFGGVGDEELLFKFSGSDNLKLRQFASQLVLYRKARLKLPTYVDKLCLFTMRAYEQASSEFTAGYKASLVSGRQLLDLTGGLGVDDFAFAQKFKQVDSVDPDAGLNDLARYNFERLGVKNVTRITATAADFLQRNQGSYDLIYLDADRREANRKIVQLKDSSPDVLSLMPELIKRTEQILLKLSPLIDIYSCIRLLKAVEWVEVVSLNNEVKEVLVFINKKFTGIPQIIATELSGADVKHRFGKLYGAEHPVPEPVETAAMQFFYEPGAALLKADLASGYAREKGSGLFQLGLNTQFYLSKNLNENFYGRTFRIVHSSPYKPKQIKDYCRENKIKRANLSRRNFPHVTEVIRKKLELKDGGDDYFFFGSSGSELLFFHCRKI